MRREGREVNQSAPNRSTEPQRAVPSSVHSHLLVSFLIRFSHS
jgi:hypothetical protein